MPKGLLIGAGLAIILIGLLVEAMLRYEWWSNKPPLSTGPVLVATVGLNCLVPLGLVILVFGTMKNGPETQSLDVRKREYAYIVKTTAKGTRFAWSVTAQVRVKPRVRK